MKVLPTRHLERILAYCPSSKGGPCDAEGGFEHAAVCADRVFNADDGVLGLGCRGPEWYYLYQLPDHHDRVPAHNPAGGSTDRSGHSGAERRPQRTGPVQQDHRARSDPVGYGQNVQRPQPALSGLFTAAELSGDPHRQFVTLYGAVAPAPDVVVRGLCNSHPDAPRRQQGGRANGWRDQEHPRG